MLNGQMPSSRCRPLVLTKLHRNRTTFQRKFAGPQDQSDGLAIENTVLL